MVMRTLETRHDLNRNRKGYTLFTKTFHTPEASRQRREGSMCICG